MKQDTLVLIFGQDQLILNWCSVIKKMLFDDKKNTEEHQDMKQWSKQDYNLGMIDKISYKIDGNLFNDLEIQTSNIQIFFIIIIL